MDSIAEVEKQEEHTLTFYHNHTDKWLTVTSVVNGESAGDQRDAAATGLGYVNSGLSTCFCIGLRSTLAVFTNAAAEIVGALPGQAS